MKYIRYEVEQNSLWGRPYLVGVWIDSKNKTEKDWLLGFGSKIKNDEAKIELQRIADFYNTSLGSRSTEDKGENVLIERVLAERRRLAKDEINRVYNEKDI